MFGMTKSAAKHRAHVEREKEKLQLQDAQDKLRRLANAPVTPGEVYPVTAAQMAQAQTQILSGPSSTFDSYLARQQQNHMEQRAHEEKQRMWGNMKAHAGGRDSSNMKVTRDDFEDAYTGIAEAHIELLESAEGLVRIKNAATMLVRNRKLAVEEFMESERAAAELKKAVSNVNSKTKGTSYDPVDTQALYRSICKGSVSDP